MTKPVAFSEDGARRVIAATKAYEGGNRSMPPVKFRSVADDGGPVRLGKTTAAWNKDTLATIELYEEGDPPNEGKKTPADTIENCVNKIAKVDANKMVIIAKGGNGHWYLVWAEPTYVDVIVGAAIGEAGLGFSRKRVGVYVGSPDPQDIIIALTSCPTS